MSALHRFTADERDQAVGAVMERHPDLDGPEFWAKVERVLAIMAHASDGPRWTGASP